MIKKGWPKIGFIFVLSISLLLLGFFIANAEEAKYIYDELGRLYQVIDEQGNAATYNYDAVGNLLSITRSTGITGPQITTISPDNAFGGETVNVAISGNNLIYHKGDVGSEAHYSYFANSDNPSKAITNKLF